jgi:hypothetical protein
MHGPQTLATPIVCGQQPALKPGTAVGLVNILCNNAAEGESMLLSP